jgi:hypothetical protein
MRRHIQLMLVWGRIASARMPRSRKLIDLTFAPRPALLFTLFVDKVVGEERDYFMLNPHTWLPHSKGGRGVRSADPKLNGRLGTYRKPMTTRISMAVALLGPYAISE